MAVKCFTKSEAVTLIRHCLDEGRVIPGKHFRQELAAEDLNLLDAFHVLRTGNVFREPEFDVRYQEWNYRMEGTEPDGKKLAIVFCFKEDEAGFLITVFSIRG
jgi:Domain of unknown function (DUF4258)